MIKKKIVQIEINDYSDLNSEELEDELTSLVLRYTCQKREAKEYSSTKDIVKTMLEIVDIFEMLEKRKDKEEIEDEESK